LARDFTISTSGQNRRAAGVIATGGGQGDAVRAGIDDDGDAVAPVEPVHERGHGLLEQREFVQAVHGAGNVDEENEVGGGPLAFLDFPALDGDPDELVAGGPRALRSVHGGRGELGGGERFHGVAIH
jgi:hypothetical protein